MLLVSILSIGLFGYKIFTNKPCSPLTVSMKGVSSGNNDASFYAGQNIQFIANGDDSKSIVWNFGDNTPNTPASATTNHSFAEEGVYFVSALSPNGCQEKITVTIKSLDIPNVKTGQDDFNAYIIGKDTPRVNEPVFYTINNNKFLTYEWTILNSPNFPTKNDSLVSYSFPLTGTYTIQLRLNDDATKVITKTIQVLPALPPKFNPNGGAANGGGQIPIITQPPITPPLIEDNKEVPKGDPEPTKPKSILIADEEFKSMLIEVTKGKKDFTDFETFLCNSPKLTKVLANGEEQTTLQEFCSKIHDNKKYKIKELTVQRDENNCVALIKVKYSKSWL